MREEGRGKREVEKGEGRGEGGEEGGGRGTYSAN
jgi:hypothetical protein